MNDHESDTDSGGVIADDTPISDGEHTIIAVDFDKTLTTGEESYITDDTETPDEEMIEWVNTKYRQNNTIIIWSARPWTAAGETVARLTEWGVDWHGLRLEKGDADVYVDDNGTTPKAELLDSGFDNDGEVGAGEGKIDKDKDGDFDETGNE